MIASSMPTATKAPPPPAVATFRNEPPADFAQTEAREAMQAALAEVASQLGMCYPLVIGGEKIETGEVLESLNPSHKHQVVGAAVMATADHARQAVTAAKQAFAAWADLPVERRADLLRRAAAAMRDRRFELAAWEVH